MPSVCTDAALGFRKERLCSETLLMPQLITAQPECSQKP